MIGVIGVISLVPGKVLLALGGSMVTIRLIYFEVYHFDPKHFSIAISDIVMNIYSSK